MLPVSHRWMKCYRHCFLDLSSLFDFALYRISTKLSLEGSPYVCMSPLSIRAVHKRKKQFIYGCVIFFDTSRASIDHDATYCTTEINWRTTGTYSLVNAPTTKMVPSLDDLEAKPFCVDRMAMLLVLTTLMQLNGTTHE